MAAKEKVAQRNGRIKKTSPNQKENPKKSSQKNQKKASGKAAKKVSSLGNAKTIPSRKKRAKSDIFLNKQEIENLADTLQYDRMHFRADEQKIKVKNEEKPDKIVEKKPKKRGFLSRILGIEINITTENEGEEKKQSSSQVQKEEKKPPEKQKSMPSAIPPQKEIKKQDPKKETKKLREKPSEEELGKYDTVIEDLLKELK